VVYEDEHVIAFMDIMPAKKGHLLVVPKAHYGALFDVPAPLLAKTAAVLQRCARGVRRGLTAEGLNVLQSNGSAAGQVVDHVHFHIIPRRLGDGLRLDWDHETYAPNEMASFAAKIKEGCEAERSDA